MVTQALRGPHSLYRRYQALLESALTAAAFAAVVVLTLDNTAVYPDNWLLVIGVGLALVGIRWPLLAYVGAVVLLTYPVFLINFYLAVLFVAVSALGHRLFVHFFGATTLVLATPFLAEYQLHWLAPILGGLWWGGATGAWVGGLSVLWLKGLAGMAGLDIDLLAIAGTGLDLPAIADNFTGANSLETLLLLIEPFAAESGVILYNLLQLFGFALAGGMVGFLAWRRWVKYSAPWSMMVVTAAGGLIMLATMVGLPYWLSEAVAESTVLATQDPVAPLFSLMVVIVVGTTVYTLRESLDLPVAPKRKGKVAARAAAPHSSRRWFTRQPGQPELSEEVEPVRRPVRVPHHSELPEWEPPNKDSGLIMLEID
jgi:hypothetical protein